VGIAVIKLSDTRAVINNSRKALRQMDELMRDRYPIARSDAILDA